VPTWRSPQACPDPGISAAAGITKRTAQAAIADPEAAGDR